MSAMKGEIRRLLPVSTGDWLVHSIGGLMRCTIPVLASNRMAVVTKGAVGVAFGVVPQLHDVCRSL